MTEANSVRAKIPTLYLVQTLQDLHSLGASQVAQLCEDGRSDGLSIARWLVSTMRMLLAVLHLACSYIELEIEDGQRYVQILLQRREHVVFELVKLLKDLSGNITGWSETLASWSPEKMLESGDLVYLWQNNFPHRLRVKSSVFLQVLRSHRNLDCKTCEDVLPWLQLDDTDDELELLNIALIMDSLGLSRGTSFCTSWEELCGHQFITAVWSESEQDRRAIMSAADIVLAQKENQSTVFMVGWSREILRANRNLLEGLVALGLSVACDSEEGLLLMFDEPTVAQCLIRPAAKSPIRLGKILSTWATSSGNEGSLAVAFDQPAANTLSHCMASRVHIRCPVQSARDRHLVFTGFNARQLAELNGYLQIFEVLEARLRAIHEMRAYSNDPSLQSDAWPLLQKTLQDQKLKDEEVARRKQRLEAMEQATDNPDQIAHIRILLREVAEAEAEQESGARWLREQKSKWVAEEEQFQHSRQQFDLACRQRMCAMLLDQRHRQLQRGRLWSEMSRTESLLLDMEEGFNSGRQRLHQHDQALAEVIHDKEDLLESLRHALATVKDQVQEADIAVTQQEEVLKGVQRVVKLNAARMRQLDEIDVLERKLGALRNKNSSVVLGAV